MRRSGKRSRRTCRGIRFESLERRWLLAVAAGDDQFTIVEDQPLVLMPWRELVAMDATWNFLHPLNGVNPADLDPDFDQTWFIQDSVPGSYDGPEFDQSGPGLLGFDIIDCCPVVTDIGKPDSVNNYSAYFTHSFFLEEEPTSYWQLALEGLIDDGAVIYLNGDEVARYNMPDWPNSFYLQTNGIANELAFVTIELGGRLRPGWNHLAISVHQYGMESSDMGFWVSLRGLDNRLGLFANDRSDAASPLDQLEATHVGDQELVNGSASIQTEHGWLTIDRHGEFNYKPQLNYVGTDAFTYRVVDGLGATDEATVTIHVQPDGEVELVTAVDDTYYVDEDQSLGLATGVELISLGSIWEYMHPQDGIDPVTADPDFYETWHTQGTAASNYDGPVFSSGPAPMAYGGLTAFWDAVGTVLQAPPDGWRYSAYFTHTFEFAGQPSAEDVLLVDLVADDGAILYLNGQETARFNMDPVAHDIYHLFSISPGNEDSFTTIPITGSLLAGTNRLSLALHNNSPVSADLGFDLRLRGVIHAQSQNPVLANDRTDGAPGSVLRVSQVQMQPVINDPVNVRTAHGSLTMYPQGVFDYWPDEDFFGTDTFRYRASDGMGNQDEAIVSIVVQAVSDPPTVVNHSFTTEEDVAVVVTSPAQGLLADANDVDGDLLTAQLVDPPVHGQVTVFPDGTFHYTPVQDYYGHDTFTFRAVSDQNPPELSNLGTVNIQIEQIIDTLVAGNDVYTAGEDATLIVPPTEGVLANDFSSTGPLSASVVSGPSFGSLDFYGDGSFSYRPNDNFDALDEFRYRVADGIGDSVTATVTIMIDAVNDAPVLADRNYSIAAGQTLIVSQPSATAARTIIPQGAIWQYTDGLVDSMSPAPPTPYPIDPSRPDVDWNDPEFDVLASNVPWKQGAAPLWAGNVSGLIDPATRLQIRDVTTTLYRASVLLNDPEAASIQQLELTYLFDDGAVVYVNGQEVARFNLCDVCPLTTRTLATGPAEENVPRTQRVDVGGLMVPGNNTIAVELHQSAPEPATIYDDLRFTEIMYNPPPPTATEIAASFDNNESFEFLEITNASLTDAYPLPNLISDGLGIIAIDPGTVLGPGERAVLVSNRGAFQQRYGTNIKIAGTYTGQLSNSGERIILTVSQGITLVDIIYNDSTHPATDGEGHSLVFPDVALPRAWWNDETVWLLSGAPGGSAGTADAVEQPSHTNPDMAFDLSVAVAQPVGLSQGLTDVDGQESMIQLVQEPQHGQVQLDADGTFTYSPDAGFVGTDRFSVVAVQTMPPDGATSEPALITVSVLPAGADTVAPRVTDIAINGRVPDPPDLPSGAQPVLWSRQRSTIHDLTITFSESVLLSSDDIRLTNRGIAAPDQSDTVIELSASNVTVNGDLLVLMFDGVSLSDGVYQLEILPSARDVRGNSLDGNGDGIGGDSYVLRGDTTNQFYQLTADWNGDAGVSIFDFTTFAYWFGQFVPRAPSYVDLNGDGGITIFDFSSFADRFGVQVIFPNPVAGTVAGLNANSIASRPSDTKLMLEPTIKDDRATLHDAALLELLSQWNVPLRTPRQSALNWSGLESKENRDKSNESVVGHEFRKRWDQTIRRPRIDATQGA